MSNHTEFWCLYQNEWKRKLCLSSKWKCVKYSGRIIVYEADIILYSILWAQRWKHCQWRTWFGNSPSVPGVFHGGVSRTGTLGRVRVVFHWSCSQIPAKPPELERAEIFRNCSFLLFFSPFLFNNTERLCICWDRSQSAHLLIIFNIAAPLHSYCFSRANYSSSATQKWIIVIPTDCW